MAAAFTPSKRRGVLQHRGVTARAHVGKDAAHRVLDAFVDVPA